MITQKGASIATTPPTTPTLVKPPSANTMVPRQAPKVSVSQAKPPGLTKKPSLQTLIRKIRR